MSNVEPERTKEPQEDSLVFKRVMRGFDPKEVMDYIDEMNRTMQDASKKYEMRMAEMKQSLTLANRERDTLRARCAELERSKADEVQREDSEECRRLRQETEELKRLLDEKNKENSVPAQALEEKESLVQQLSSQLRIKEQKLSEQSALIAEYENRTDDHAELRGKYEEALALIETMRADTAALEEENDGLSADAKQAALRMQKTADENAELKTELGRANVENSLLKEKNENYKKELSALKAEAKERAYENAEKLSAEAEAFNQKKIRLKKQMQMQDYHIELAENAVAELKNQLEQIRLSFEE